MPLIITPGQLSQLAELYHQLGSMTEAGLGLPQAIDHLQRTAPSAKTREHLAAISLRLQQGFTLSEAMRQVHGWLPAFDVSLIEAGEKSGRLDSGFKLLGEYYRNRAELIRSVIGNLAYPVFIAHIAVVVFPIRFLTGLVLSDGLTAFVIQKLAILVPVYTVVIGGTYLCQARHGERWRSIVEKLFHPVPLLGSARRSLAVARTAAALEALINAGVNIIPAWELAATASGSPSLRRAVLAWKPLLENGQTPAEILTRRREFPELFTSLYHSGEISGKLDDSLKRLHHHFQEEGQRKLHSFAKWSGHAVHIGIMLAVAWQIISFYLNYFNQINQAIGS